MKMAGSSWSTLLLSKVCYQRSVVNDLLSTIDSACAASLEAFSKQTARQLGLGQIRGPSWLTDTPRPGTTGRSPLSPTGGLCVCDAWHRVFVMKKGGRQELSYFANARWSSH